MDSRHGAEPQLEFAPTAELRGARRPWSATEVLILLVVGVAALQLRLPGLGAPVMFVDEAEGSLIIRAHAFGPAVDTLRVSVDGEVVHREAVTLGALEVLERVIAREPGSQVRVELPGLGLRYDPRAEGSTLTRPFTTPPDAPVIKT